MTCSIIRSAQLAVTLGKVQFGGVNSDRKSFCSSDKCCMAVQGELSSGRVLLLKRDLTDALQAAGLYVASCDPLGNMTSDKHQRCFLSVYFEAALHGP